MNLLEHYILQVYTVDVINCPPRDDGDVYVKVTALCDCWGDKRVCSHATTRKNWERELALGYFMA